MTSSVYSPKASSYVAIGFCAAMELQRCFDDQGSYPTCVVLLSSESLNSSHFARLTLVVFCVCFSKQFLLCWVFITSYLAFLYRE